MNGSNYCERCSGCGQVVGNGDFERPWTRLEGISPSAALETILGVRRPQPCPACQGSGRKPPEFTTSPGGAIH